jgi:chaperone required for assembly of F1-ATPase
MSRRRFYKEVVVAAPDAEHTGYRILLDGKPIKTPSRATLAVPRKPLAQAVAEEWSAQEGVIRPETMILTKLANTAIDRVAPDPAHAREQILVLARSDVVCYRAETPADLVERERQAWDPVLAWLKERFGASLRSASGIGFVAQDDAAIAALSAALLQRNAFFIAGLYAAAALLGSVVLALALSEGELDSEEAFSRANLDKIYQAERWGWDEQDKVKTAAERSELRQISRFLELLSQ